MIKLKQIAGACAATAMLAATIPAFAQSSTPNPQAADRAYTTDTRKEDNNWGWIGLLGLVGLMGLKRANHDDTHRRTSTHTPGRA